MAWPILIQAQISISYPATQTNESEEQEPNQVAAGVKVPRRAFAAAWQVAVTKIAKTEAADLTYLTHR